MAIGIKVKKMDVNVDPGVSKFFGDPTVPAEWSDKWSDDVIFFCQIKLSDIAALNTEKSLPDKGYLYVLLDVESYPYTPMIYYYDGEPNMVIDEFNTSEPEFSHLTQGYEMSFSSVDDAAEGMKLFGIPSDWSYEKPAPKLFLQFDPLEGGTGFLENIDGFVYFFFGEDENDFENIQLHIENS